MKKSLNHAAISDTTFLSKNKARTQQLTKMAMFSALSIILLALIRVPIFPAAPWMEYDMADVPILLSTFMLGPIAGIKVLILVCLLQVIFFAGNGVIGFLMHFIATGVFILVAYFIASKMKETKGMIIGLILGTIAMAAVMIPLNLIFTVHFFGTPKEVVDAMMIPVIIPFNLIKAGLNSILFFIVYKIISKVSPKLITNQRKF